MGYDNNKKLTMKTDDNILNYYIGYAPLGSLYTSSPPNNNHFYGTSIQQVENFPNHSLKYEQKFDQGEGVNPTLASIYLSNNPNYHAKSETNFSGRSEYLSSYKVV
jgi:hypothetical protein